MRNLWSDLHIAHDMSGFGHMSGLIKGVAHYSDRAMLLPGAVVYVRKDESGLGLVDEHVAFLKRPEVSLGPQKVVQVGGNDIFSGIMSDPFVLEGLQKATMRGSRVQVFCMTKRAEAFFAEALISANRIDTAPLQISSRLNDKIELRRIGVELGLQHAFLEHEVATDPARVVEAVKAFLARPQEEVPFVVLKQADLAGGDGFLKIMRDDDLDALLHPYFGRFENKRIIVEEGHPHKALSIQVAVRERPKGFRIVGWTRQLVHADQGRHFGNSMVRMAPGQEHPLIHREHRHSMETWSVMFSEYAHDRIVGYHGTIGFDLLLLKRPRKDRRDLFMGECNARETASTYPLAVSHQLEGRGATEWGITMWNAVPTSARSYGEALAKLGDLTFSVTRGIVPFNPRLIALPEEYAGKFEGHADHLIAAAGSDLASVPAARLRALGAPPERQVGIIAVGKDLAEAGRMGREAKRRLMA